MRKTLLRGLVLACLAGTAVVAYAVGTGEVTAAPGVTIITISSPTGTGTGTATLHNTTGATTYNVLVGSDPSCDPTLTFAVSGGNPAPIAPGGTRSVQLGCPARGTPAMRRCLYHAKNQANGLALADFMTVCLYGSSTTLTPLQTTLDFGTLAVGDNAMLPLELRNDGSQPITRVYLQTSDLAGNFQVSTPCNPDGTFCDANVPAIAPGASLGLQIKCTPQAAGTHTAQLYVGTNTYQLLAQPVTLTCAANAASAPVLGVNPTTLDLAPLDVTAGSATTVIHLANVGGGTLLINDIRIVDVDAGAAMDWTYTASGECSGVISASCSLDAGELVDINLTFDPSAIGRRRAMLLVSYRDTIDRTKEIPLGASSVGATIETAQVSPTLAFGMVPVGRTSTLDVELVNRGNRDITAQLAFAAGGTPPFTLTPSTSLVLPPHVDKSLAVTCAPTVAGNATATITAQAMDAFGSTPVMLNASCEGSTLPVFANPTGVNLGEIRIGAGTVRRTIQLVAVSSPVTLAGQPQLEAANTAITLGALSQLTTPASFELAINPQVQADLATSVVVTTSDGDTLRIPVTGRVVTADYEVAPKLDLGTFCVNQATSSSNASLVSVGTGTIALAQPTLGPGSAFQLLNAAPTLYPVSLASGKSVTVALTPQRQSSPGELADTLTWHTDVEGKLTATTALSVRFIDKDAAIAPPALNFGKVTVHLYREEGQRVVLQNCNPTPLVLDPPMIKTPFSIDGPALPAMLNPNETVTFSVGFHPHRIGRVVDTLRITSPQLPADKALEVVLVGEGVTTELPPPDAGTGGGKDDTSFYACSCRTSRPGGALPLVLALLCALRPRRRGARG